MNATLWKLLLLPVLLIATVASPGDEGILQSNSQRPYSHRITLYDEEGRAIDPQDREPGLFSMMGTCGKCHDVSTISSGWHFNAVRDSVEKGRPGEPWILTDRRTGTQLPMSYRGWKGTWNPDELGISRSEFVRLFGRHLPGGGPGVPNEEAMDDPDTSWHATGPMEIDCNACHLRDRSYDPSQRQAQIEKGNFAYVSIATMGMGIVRGSVDESAETKTDDPLAMFDPALEDAQPGKVSLEIEYDLSRFDADDRVFFDLTRKSSEENCYQCHSRHVSEPEWASRSHYRDEDVHLDAGLSCTDCHRNGIAHDMVRGFEDESDADPFLQTLTCRGCHYGTEETANGRPGRLGSPLPDHHGIPPIHFEKMSCTSCHSGPIPEENPQIIQTSMSHGLGLAEFQTPGNKMPYIQQPVYIPGHDGKLTPHRLLWPAFWATQLEDGSITPILPQTVLENAADILTEEIEEQGLDKTTVQQVLETLNAADSTGRDVVYVSSGTVHSLEENGSFVTHTHPVAEPYAWPLAHDVRPAGRSLGAKGCQECHAPDSPFMFGNIPVISPTSGPGEAVRAMTDFSGLDEAYHTTFAEGFRYRKAFKVIGFIAGGLLAMLLLAFSVRALIHLSDRFGGTTS